MSNWQPCTAVSHLLTLLLLLLLLAPHTPGDDNDGSGSGSGNGSGNGSGHGKNYKKKPHHYTKDKECKKVCPAGPQVREGHTTVTPRRSAAQRSPKGHSTPGA